MAVNAVVAGAATDAPRGREKKNFVKWPVNLPAFLSVLGGVALIAWHASRYGAWVVDDAGITFAYSRSLAEGLGPVVQPGAEPVEGYSNPAWMALLALGRLLGLFDHGTLFGIPDYVLFPKALALGCCAGILVAGYVAARAVTSRPWLVTAVFGAVLAAVPSFVIWCFSGLENSLYALTVVWLAVLVFRAVLDDRLLSARVALSAGGLAALAALTRPEGLLYAAAYPLVVLIGLRRTTLGPSLRRSVLSTLAFTVPTGTYFCWRYLEFGRLLPNTVVSKRQAAPAIENLTRSGELVTYAGAPAVLVLTALVGLSLGRPGRWRAGFLALHVPLTLALTAYAVLQPDWMGQFRFATPVWALGALTSTLAAADAVRRARARARVLLAATLAAAMIPSAASFTTAAEQFRAAPTFPLCFIADRYGRVFNAYADILGTDHASLLVADLGGSAMTSRLHLVDLGGLADPTIATYIHDGDLTGLRNHVFTTIKPTFITSHLHGGELNGIPTDPRLNQDYYPIFTSPHPDPVPSGDWVRKDAVPTPATLTELRAYADTNTARVDRTLNQGNLTASGWPNNCGPTLRAGQTQTSRR
ncbi:MAG TPA: hypothetical protein VJT49_17830 [Amycolatopsis sp.]|uniref:hypothetical protein n=1 Tax=Amycolatopsis sp. TaxID=37632 RepID=UPI002B4858CD|nr:hypothetical protein [Amycolatopsis sp.]HKS46932.1 hypothetical protein [Amycolatopsis sp.]